MKIGWVAPGGFDRNGVETIPVFLGLLERLTSGNDVHVFALQQGSRMDSFGLCRGHIHEMGGSTRAGQGMGLLRRTLRAIRLEHRRAPFDVLHGLWANQSGLAAALAGRLLRIPVVITLAGGELACLPEINYGGELTRRSRLQVRLALRLARAVTAATEFIRVPLLKLRPDAHLLPLGVDTGFYAPPEEAVVGPPWRLIHISHLNRVKDQATLLRAFRRIVDEDTDAHLEIIGEDTLNGAIQQMASDLGLVDSLTFRGPQPISEVVTALRQSHLLLHTSKHEAGQVVFLEAAACGVPTVGTAVGYVADLAPVAAVAVPIGDAEALATEAIRLLRDAATRKEIAAHARIFALEHDADWTATRLEKIYASLNSER